MPLRKSIDQNFGHRHPYTYSLFLSSELLEHNKGLSNFFLSLSATSPVNTM